MDSCHQSGMSLPLCLVPQYELFVPGGGTVEFTAFQKCRRFSSVICEMILVYRFIFYLNSYDFILI